MIEEWKPIKGYEGLYVVSNVGKVQSLPRNGTTKEGTVLQPDKTFVKRCGYEQVVLSKFGVTKTFKVHRLVAGAFIPNPTNKPQINHIDGNKLNNHSNNLEWATPTENMRHAINSKLVTYQGEGNPKAKLIDKYVLEIRTMYKSGFYTQKELAEIFNVTQAQISTIVLRKQWQHI